MASQLKKTTKYQTVANAEEQHLAAMSSTTTTTMMTSSKVKSTGMKKVINNEEQQVTVTADSHNDNTEKKKTKVTKKKTSSSSTTTTTTTTATATAKSAICFVQNEGEQLQQQHEAIVAVEKKQLTNMTTANNKIDATAMGAPSTLPTGKVAADDTDANSTKDIMNGKKKTKGKKSKNKTETDQQNISMKTSFSKFDALQKRNLIHQASGEQETNCRLCSKPVYKMEEVKAEKSIYHKNCLRCHECNKQLKVDNYQSHEGVLYCLMHFKLLLAPKCVEDSEPEKPRKPELIIRENQPMELPPDVVRASDKPDLGLEELQKLNVRSRFQVFEHGVQQQQRAKDEAATVRNTNGNVKRSNTILTKLAKLQAHGLSAGISTDEVDAMESQSDSDDEAASGSDDDDEGADNENTDIDLVRSKKRTQRERPVGIGKAMNDIKTRFEKGHHMTKEERREERKQEIQNIRSRLFMGKQARIKEMYQQAVADSEQAITAAGKKPEIDIGNAARSIKERFEKGEMFKNAGTDNEDDDAPRTGGIQNDADVFESAISKASRSIFMELDANAGKNQLPNNPANNIQRSRSSLSQRQNSENEQENVNILNQQQQDVVKCDEKPEDIKIETSEISSKFKFFETYRPTECKKKEFRITPPREGVVKMPEPESDQNEEESPENDVNVVQKSNTASIMLNKFRELEQSKHSNRNNGGPRPLKCFTPPPDGGRRVYQEQDSDLGSQEEEEDDEDEEDEEEDDDNHAMRRSKLIANDEALKEAQAAARAKQLRAKFEKWEANEVQREMNDGPVDIYSQQVSDDSAIETTKSIRDRFENMQSLEKQQPTRPRYQVNRFV